MGASVAESVMAGHIVIEVLLLITIIYLLMQKSYKPEKPLTPAVRLGFSLRFC
jgi:hypothetical protein